MPGEGHRRAQHATHHELSEQQAADGHDLREARAHVRGDGGADGRDRDDDAGRRGHRVDVRHVRDLQRNEQAEPAVDELRDEQETHHGHEVTVAQEITQRCRPRPSARVARLERTRFAEEEDQRDQRDRAHARRDEERGADAEMRGRDAPDDRADRDAEELRALDTRDRQRHLVARRCDAGHRHGHRGEAGEESLAQARDEELLHGGHQAHRGDDHREPGERANQHHLAAEAVGEAAEERREQPRDGRRHGREQSRPQRDLRGIGHAELANVERQERREELKADERDEDAQGQRPDVALPALIRSRRRQRRETECARASGRARRAGSRSPRSTVSVGRCP